MAGPTGLGSVQGSAACAHLASRIEQLRLVRPLRRPRRRSLRHRRRDGRGRGSRRLGSKQHGARVRRRHCGRAAAADRVAPRSAGGSWRATAVGAGGVELGLGAGRVRIALGELFGDLLACPVQRCALVRQLLPVVHPGPLQASGAALAPAALRQLAGHGHAPPLALLLVAEHCDATRRSALLEVEPSLQRVRQLLTNEFDR